MNHEYKYWGYEEDELKGTFSFILKSKLIRTIIDTNHPVWKHAPHTDSANDMVNGITYGKGCGFLKQLYHLIGHDASNNFNLIY